jgi:hypothetical protein
MLEQTLARGGIALAVVIQPSGQLAGGQRLAAQLFEQALGIGVVGARQRHQHPVRRPGGDHPIAHRLLQRLGQCREQCQAPIHPARVLAHARGQGALAHALGHHRREQPGLLDRLERARLMTRQHLRQGLGQRALPHRAAGRIPAQASQCLPAPVAIDQHQALAGWHRDHRHLLTVGLDRGNQLAHRTRVIHAGMGKGGVDAMQIDRLTHVCAWLAHAHTVSRYHPQRYRVLSLQSPPAAAQSSAIALITKSLSVLTRPHLQSSPPGHGRT